LKQSIFDYSDYKTYLEARIRLEGRGAKSRLAAALRCHVAYISQILNDSAHLSLEQAHAANAYFAHGAEEADFHLLLVLRDRAGTADLRHHYQKKVDEALRERERLRNALQYKRTLNRAEQTTYYSAWYYAAVHILLTIPEYRSRDRIARHLGLAPEQVSQALEFLEAAGLAVRSGSNFRAGDANLHVGDDSPMMRLQHEHWRLRAIHALDRTDREELHYSSVISLAEEDLPRVRKILLEAIRQIREVVRPSPEEVAYCYLLDLFRV
jgi:uncharacterized protein (TIGR02147 family)